MNKTFASCRIHLLMLATFVVSGTSVATASPTDFIASGSSVTDLQSTVDSFRSAISLGGVNNGVAGGPFVNGRREINWDAPALDAFASPNVMPDNFFNNNSKRGALFSASAGGRLLVSQRTDGPTARFGDIATSYNSQFQVFSPQRLFGIENGTVVTSTFFVPNSPTTQATINGFGAVFTDVDRTDSTAIEFYTDINNQNVLLRRLLVPASTDGGLSFAGTFFGDGERVSMVKIIAGNTGLGSLESGANDVVAMDDFFYSEPLAVPAPGVVATGAVMLCAVGTHRRRTVK